MPPSASTYTLAPVSLSAPSSRRPFMTLTFRAPSGVSGSGGGGSGRSRSNPIYPATSLQLSFEHGGHEPFIERTTLGEIRVAGGEEEVTAAAPGEGERGGKEEERLCSFQVPQSAIPRFASKRGVAGRGGEEEGEEVDTVVRLHAWKGEKLLGTWTAGSLRGLEVRGR